VQTDAAMLQYSSAMPASATAMSAMSVQLIPSYGHQSIRHLRMLEHCTLACAQNCYSRTKCNVFSVAFKVKTNCATNQKSRHCMWRRCAASRQWCGRKNDELSTSENRQHIIWSHTTLN